MNTLYNQINPYVRFVNYLTNCNNTNHIVPWRTLYDYEIIFVTRGRIIVETREQTYTVSEGQFHIMSPNIEHTRFFYEGESCDYFNIHLDFFYDQYMPDFSAQIVYTEHITPINISKRQQHASPLFINRVDCATPEKTRKLFEKLLTKYRNTRIIYKQVLLKSICLKIIHEIILSCDKANTSVLNSKAGKYNELISKFIDYVENNYKLDISVPDFIKDKGISLIHFVRVFKEAKSITPNDFIIEYRFTLAKELLSSGNYFVYEIADMVGYPNQFFFSRLFKKREGCSPAEYIKNSTTKDQLTQN